MIRNLKIRKSLYSLLLTGNILLISGCDNTEKNNQITEAIQESDQKNISEDAYSLDDIVNYCIYKKEADNEEKYFLGEKKFENNKHVYYNVIENKIEGEYEVNSFEYCFENIFKYERSLCEYIIENNLKKKSYTLKDLEEIFNKYVDEQKKVNKNDENLFTLSDYVICSDINEYDEKEYYICRKVSVDEDGNLKAIQIYPDDTKDVRTLKYEENLQSYIYEKIALNEIPKKQEYSLDDIINILDLYIEEKIDSDEKQYVKTR